MATGNRRGFITTVVWFANVVVLGEGSWQRKQQQYSLKWYFVVDPRYLLSIGGFAVNQRASGSWTSMHLTTNCCSPLSCCVPTDSLTHATCSILTLHIQNCQYRKLPCFLALFWCCSCFVWGGPSQPLVWKLESCLLHAACSILKQTRIDVGRRFSFHQLFPLTSCFSS